MISCREADLSSIYRGIGLVLTGAVGVALAARWSVAVPGSAVPQSMQTLAVLVVGVLFGPRLGQLALVTYLALGGIGLPVFADGESGLARLHGPTAGYLVGFVAAASLAGSWARRPGSCRWWDALAGMVVAHVVILWLGWARLAFELSAEAAWASGVKPFLLGALVKSLIAAPVAVAVARRTRSG